MLPFSINVASANPAGLKSLMCKMAILNKTINKRKNQQLLQQKSDPSACSGISRNGDGISFRSALTALNLPFQVLSVKPVQLLNKSKTHPQELLSVTNDCRRKVPFETHPSFPYLYPCFLSCPASPLYNLYQTYNALGLNNSCNGTLNASRQVLQWVKNPFLL